MPVPMAASSTLATALPVGALSHRLSRISASRALRGGEPFDPGGAFSLGHPEPNQQLQVLKQALKG